MNIIFNIIIQGVIYAKFQKLIAHLWVIMNFLNRAENKQNGNFKEY